MKIQIEENNIQLIEETNSNKETINNIEESDLQNLEEQIL